MLQCITARPERSMLGRDDRTATVRGARSAAQGPVGAERRCREGEALVTRGLARLSVHELRV